jgi:hypothetical protein
MTTGLITTSYRGRAKVNPGYEVGLISENAIPHIRKTCITGPTLEKID